MRAPEEAEQPEPEPPCERDATDDYYRAEGIAERVSFQVADARRSPTDNDRANGMTPDGWH